MVCEIIPQKLGRILPPIYPEQPVLKIGKIPSTEPKWKDSRNPQLVCIVFSMVV